MSEEEFNSALYIAEHSRRSKIQSGIKYYPFYLELNAPSLIEKFIRTLEEHGIDFLFEIDFYNDRIFIETYFINSEDLILIKLLYPKMQETTAPTTLAYINMLVDCIVATGRISKNARDWRFN